MDKLGASIEHLVTQKEVNELDRKVDAVRNDNNRDLAALTHRVESLEGQQSRSRAGAQFWVTILGGQFISGCFTAILGAIVAYYLTKR